MSKYKRRNLHSHLTNNQKLAVVHPNKLGKKHKLVNKSIDQKNTTAPV